MLSLASSARPRARRAYLALRRTTSSVLIERVMGVETSRDIDLDGLGIHAPGRQRYEPSGWLDLRRILRPSDVGEEDVFLDLGSGKGRVVMQAAQYGFRRVIGVELSPELNAVAEANVEARGNQLRCTDIQFVTGDVTEYAIPEDVNVIYLFNPVRGEAFAALVLRIAESLDRQPRLLRVIYNTPLEGQALLQTGLFRLERAARGLRPGRAWSRKTAIHMYVAEPSR